MEETKGGEIWLQVLQAVQALDARMDKLDARMDKLDARMDKLDARMDKLDAKVDGLGSDVGSLRSVVGCLGADVGILRLDVDSLKGRMDKLESKMDKQHEWLQRLGAESIGWRDELRGEFRQMRMEVQDGFRRVKARIDLTDGAVVLMASVLRRPTELGQELEQRLVELEVS
jgi:outer membrane murein-binding lipoprotein Lpp